MDIGFEVGANVPTAVLVLHSLLALVFVAFGVNNLQNGRPVGLVLNGFIALLVVVAGVTAGRITWRR
jgi:hypothetical protein